MLGEAAILSLPRGQTNCIFSTKMVRAGEGQMMNWLGETLPSCDVFLGDPSWQSCPVLKGSPSVGQIGSQMEKQGKPAGAAAAEKLFPNKTTKARAITGQS